MERSRGKRRQKNKERRQREKRERESRKNNLSFYLAHHHHPSFPALSFPLLSPSTNMCSNKNVISMILICPLAWFLTSEKNNSQRRRACFLFLQNNPLPLSLLSLRFELE